jgi:hypothetical protein
MRALVAATVRLFRAPAGVGQQPSPPLPIPELRQRVDRWSDPRQPQDDLPVEDEEPEEGDSWGPSHGILIAATTFVPTFLATFLGVGYLAGPPMGARSPAGLQGEPQPAVSALAPQREPQREIVATPRQQAQPPKSETVGDTAVTAPPVATPRPASRPTHPQVEPKAAKPKRPVSTGRTNDAWVRGAAFSDRDSAERLAASIERQGYPATVRRGDTPDTRWVVWIGKHPRGITPSERRK